MPAFNSLCPPRVDLNVVGCGVSLSNRFPCSRYAGSTRDMRFCADMEFMVHRNSLGSQVSVPLCCIFDTGAMVSIFQKSVAEALFKSTFPSDAELQVAALEGIGIGKASIPYYYFEIPVVFRVGPHQFLLPVRFPVKLSGMNQYEWTDIVNHNIIGMGGFIKDRMICFTEEKLFIFGMLNPLPGN